MMLASFANPNCYGPNRKFKKAKHYNFVHELGTKVHVSRSSSDLNAKLSVLALLDAVLESHRWNLGNPVVHRPRRWYLHAPSSRR